MFCTNEPLYSIDKPPILLVTKLLPFVCEVCHRKGMGPQNSKVHPGKCREAHSRAIAKRAADKRKRRKVAEVPVADIRPADAIAC